MNSVHCRKEMVNIISDEELAKLLQKGNEQALDVLVTRYHKKIFSYIYRMCRDYHAAKDISQEVLIKVCRNIRKYDGNYRFSTWIYAIASNACKDYLKSAYARKIVPVEQEPLKNMMVEYCTPEVFLQKQGEKERIADTLGPLREIYQEVLILRFYEGMKLNEIAMLLAVPQGKVKFKLFNGLQQLRKIMGGEGIEDEKA
jgi:RNA polymerase sigma factor (sigma-70 family)